MRSLVVGEPASYDVLEISRAPPGATFKDPLPVSLRPIALALTATLALAACSKNPLQITRSPCPAVAIPAYTGDVTLFSRPGTTNADAIDVVAAITNVRGGCTEGVDQYATNVSFTVLGRRNDKGAARDVTLPYFVAVVRSGDNLIAKETGQVTLHFADGQDRASTTATAQSSVSRAAATLPADINERLNRNRKAGDEDAAIDPMTDPKVRDAVRSASFEVLVGFQLDQTQLAYNVTK